MNITIFHRVNDSHSGMDDTADWAITNMSQLRTAEIDTPRAPNGCDQQGRHPQEAASSCTEIGADGVPSEWESASFKEWMRIWSRVSVVLLTTSVSLISTLLLIGVLNNFLVQQ